MTNTLNNPLFVELIANTIVNEVTLVENRRDDMANGSPEFRKQTRRRLLDQRDRLITFRDSLRLAVRCIEDSTSNHLVDLYAKALTDVNALLSMVAQLLVS